ncbi:MAG: CHASE4 domain-containing protein, partial [Fimbriimonadales bacterium]
MPLWLRKGQATPQSRWNRLRGMYARIPVGLRFVLLLLMTILILQIPYLWFSHREMTQIVETQYRITLLHQLKSAQMALKQEMRRFQRHTEDYSIWEEAIRAIRRRDTQWLATNIWEWGVVHLGYESAAVWNSDGILLGYAGMPPEKFLTPARRLYEKAQRGIGDVGLVALGERLYMVACTPVRDEDMSETVHGVLCFVNEVDKSLQLALWGGSAGIEYHF